MKIQTAKSNGEQGNFLLVSLMISAILGITLASYMIMTSNQNLSVMRSQNWNSSMAVTEAGVEDGLEELNRYNGTFNAIGTWTNTATSDGWEVVAANVYHVRRYLGTSYFDAYITNLTESVTNGNTAAIVSAVGCAPWNYSVASAPQTMFAAAGVTVSNAP